jgi:hypothetical protein
LSLTGLLGSKLHAILDRGTRRDFFDLYMLLERHRLGLVECLRALREVYRAADVNEGLVLRALSHFDDAEGEAALPGEGAGDFAVVKAYFQTSVGALLLAPSKALSFAERVVDVAKNTPGGFESSKPTRKKAVTSSRRVPSKRRR